MDHANWFLRTAADHLALVALAIGPAAGYAAGLLAERDFIPMTLPARTQQGITILITLCVSWLLATGMWGALVPADPFKMRAVVSIVAALLAPFTYPTIGRFMTKRFPSIGSIWAAN